jgi:hypothetical protein
MLHELGHVLGLPDSTNRQSVLFKGHGPLRKSLSGADVAAVQALYGARPLGTKGGRRDNDTLATARRLNFGDDESSTFDGTTPAIAYGDVTTLGDQDFFAMQAPPTGGPMTFRVLTSGISLLEPRLTVYDATGQVLEESASTNLLGDVLSITLPQTTAAVTYYARVDGATGSLFGIGHYGLAVTWDSTLTVTTAQIDAVLRGPYGELPTDDVNEIFRDPENALFHTDYPPHTTIATALPLLASGGLANQHFDLLDHLDTGGAAYYQLQAPSGTGQPVVLTTAINALSVNGLLPEVQVLDATGHAVPFDILVNDTGTTTIQAANLNPGATYYLGLTIPQTGRQNDGEDDTGNTRGNYSLVVDFRQPQQLLQTFSHGKFTALAARETQHLFVAQNQLFHFVLSATGPNLPPGTAVRMNILNSAGRTVFDLMAPAGEPISGDTVLLTPGAYVVRFIELLPNGGVVRLNFSLRGAVLSDPIGPVINDPRSQPLYTDPTNPSVFQYPDGSISLLPYLWLPTVL